MEPARRRSPLLVVLSALVAAQGALLLGLALFNVLELARGGAGGVSGGDPEVIFASIAGISAVGGVGLMWAARGLYRGRRWARAPALVVQLIIGLVAVGPGGVMSAGLPYVAVPLLAWAVFVTVLLFVPRVSAELAD